MEMNTKKNSVSQIVNRETLFFGDGINYYLQHELYREDIIQHNDKFKKK